MKTFMLNNEEHQGQIVMVPDINKRKEPVLLIYKDGEPFMIGSQRHTMMKGISVEYYQGKWDLLKALETAGIVSEEDQLECPGYMVCDIVDESIVIDDDTVWQSFIEGLSSR